MHHPRGLGPPPLRGVSGGQRRGPSEPPCGLRPCANPMNPPDRSIPDKRKQYQALQKTPLPNSRATLKPTLQVQAGARGQNRAARRTAAPRILLLIRHALTHCLNCLPPTRGLANYPREIRKLTTFPTDLGGLPMTVTRLLHPELVDRTSECSPGKIGKGQRIPALA